MAIDGEGQSEVTAYHSAIGRKRQTKNAHRQAQDAMPWIGYYRRKGKENRNVRR
ncbi:MAG: hypothetical protein IJL50_06205 [Bacteroidaceae bacterium]|nr:hypothetical protein [Bacteroidaceae bacterium]